MRAEEAVSKRGLVNVMFVISKLALPVFEIVRLRVPVVLASTCPKSKSVVAM